jgi:uncharacterized protein
VDQSTRLSAETFRHTFERLSNEDAIAEHIDVYFFGGEPLLNKEIIRYACKFLRDFSAAHGFTYSIGITTNATLLDRAFVDFVAENRIAVGISIDGTREQHDANRPNFGGRGSYDLVRRNLEYFFERYPAKNRTCRLTVAENNLEFHTAVDHLLGIGFNDVGVGFAVESVFHPVEGPKSIATLSRSLREIASWLVDAAAGRRSLFRLSLIHDVLVTLYSSRGKHTACGASDGYVAISPDGSIVPCHRYLGSSRRRLGNVWDATVNLRRLYEPDFQPVDAIPHCAACWARRLCGGECHEILDAITIRGRSQAPLCQLRYEIFRAAIDVYLDVEGMGQEALRRLVAFPYNQA